MKGSKWMPLMTSALVLLSIFGLIGNIVKNQDWVIWLAATAVTCILHYASVQEMNGDI